MTNNNLLKILSVGDCNTSDRQDTINNFYEHGQFEKHGNNLFPEGSPPLSKGNRVDGVSK